ncbi:hypothetical protein [Streptomyces sp. XD-27]|uniref:hypothetical protein n=1 Tax=Streptomyces sp. XD-27 TaxID=3062779 RepID=UPI0026F44DB6|nr:hypothetical protein [Streptomyces sp. XD-27]WKX70527.1 hypothetical protein Q3Y56_11905 [Streptomyces sp. XD-27]
MTAAVAPTLTKSLLSDATVVRMRPRYEGVNICTWIGFKHVNYLVEEAVLIHLKESGLSARQLYEEHGLGVDFVRLDTRILHALHLDDEAEATVEPVRGKRGKRGKREKGENGEKGEEQALTFKVTLRVDRDGATVKAVTSTVRLALRVDTYLPAAAEVPADLRPFAVERLGADLPPVADPAPESAAAATAALAAGGDEEAVLAALTRGRNAHAWKWTVSYPYCHFTERLQLSGYLRLMEEAKDRFVAARGISIKTLLDERRWIPVVPRSQVRVVDEALMEEDLYTVYTVEEVFKDLTYTSRMDNYVIRNGSFHLVQTGTITHGYAEIADRRDWRLVPFDQKVLDALDGKPVDA